MKFLALAIAAIPATALAQSPTIPEGAVAAPAMTAAPAALAAPAMRQIILAPNAEVVVTPNDSLTTKGKKLKQGSKFRMSTMFDVMQDGYVVIPKGTVGEGTITWLTNKGSFGKSGKMEVSFDRLELGDQRVSLTGSFRQEGEGNTGATVGAAVAVGIFSAFVTGRSATIVNGQQLRARTVEPLTFTVPENASRVAVGTLVRPAVAAAIQPTPIAAPAASGQTAH